MLENNKQKLIWVFKRQVKSEYQKHLIFKVIELDKFEYIKRAGWNKYYGPHSVNDYMTRMEGKWDNPWVK